MQGSHTFEANAPDGKTKGNTECKFSFKELLQKTQNLKLTVE